MLEQPLVQILLLLGAALSLVWACQRLQVPSLFGYLLAGVLLGPYTPGPVIEGHQLRPFAEYGIVFLLFTVGLGFAPTQLRALRRTVLGLGIAQVLLTIFLVAPLAWLVGFAPASAVALGAIFVQSSTAIIGSRRYPQVPIIARARDLEQAARLRAAGALYAYPELIESSLQLGAAALRLAGARPEDIDQLIQGIRERDYRQLSEPAPPG